MDNTDSKPQQTGGLKLMTVFIAVLALHVLVIGGFTVYHLMGSGSDADLTLDKNHKLKADGTLVTETTAPDATAADKTADATASTDTATTPSSTGSTTAGHDSHGHDDSGCEASHDRDGDAGCSALPSAGHEPGSLHADAGCGQFSGNDRPATPAQVWRCPHRPFRG